MDTFKRTPFNIVKNLAYTLFTPVVLAFIVNILLTSFTTLSQDIIMYSALGTGVLVFLGMAYSLVFSEAIKIEINGTSLLYYKRNKLIGTYSFEDYNFGYRQVQQGSTTDTIDLKVQNNNTGEEFTLNCEPLGPRQFRQMFDLIQSKTFQDESIVLNAGGVQWHTVSIGPVEVPLFIIIVFCAGMAFSIIAVFISRANKKKLLEGRTDDPKILLKGLEVQTVDGKPIKTFHQGRYVAIVLEPGEHALVVVGSEVEYHGLRGRSSTTKTTSPTKLTITVEAHKTYELTFDFDSGFNLNAID